MFQSLPVFFHFLALLRHCNIPATLNITPHITPYLQGKPQKVSPFTTPFSLYISHSWSLRDVYFWFITPSHPFFLSKVAAAPITLNLFMGEISNWGNYLILKPIHILGFLFMRIYLLPAYMCTTYMPGAYRSRCQMWAAMWLLGLKSSLSSAGALCAFDISQQSSSTSQALTASGDMSCCSSLLLNITSSRFFRNPFSYVLLSLISVVLPSQESGEYGCRVWFNWEPTGKAVCACVSQPCRTQYGSPLLFISAFAISHKNRIISSQLSSWSSDLNLNISNQMTHTYNN